MGAHDEMKRQAKRKFRPEARDHDLCLRRLEESEQAIKELEQRLHDALDASSKSDEAHLKEKQSWQDERSDLRAKVKQLEEDVKHEKRRASQALDVSERTSEAASGIGRLLHVLVNNEVLEELRLSAHDRRAEARERMRHRSPG
jgi:hypothetical protein